MHKLSARCEEPQAGGSEILVLERIARGDPLDDCLLDLLAHVERQSVAVTAAICLFDAGRHRVERIVSPSLPRAVREGAAGLPLGDPATAPCAMAAARGTAAVVIDLGADASWPRTAWGQMILRHGYRHCRSTPVFDSAGRPCATVVLLSKDPDPTSVTDARLSNSAADLVSIAVERETSREKLRASEERLRLAIDAADLGVWDWNLRTGELSLSDRCREVFQFPPAERATISRFLDVVHEDDRELVSCAVQKTLTDGRLYDVEFRIPLPDGSVRWISAKGRAFPSEDGSTGFVRGIAHDISSRKSQALALEDAERTLRLAVEATGLGLWDWDAIRGCGTQDRRCMEFFGGSMDYERWKASVHPDDRERAIEIFEAALRSDGPPAFANEYRVIHPDGSVRWIAGFGSVLSEVRDGQRVVTRIIGANLDITGRKAGEQAVLASAERFRFLADAVPHKIFTAEAAGRADYLNRQWETFTGRPLTDVLARSWRDFLHPDDVNAVEEAWGHSLEAGSSFECAYRLRRSDGEFRWHLGRAEPVRGPGGEVLLWVGTVTEIHDLKTAQLELRDREERFRTMANATPVLIWMADLSQGCTYFNQRWLRFTGRPQQLEIGRGWLDGVHPDDRSFCEAAYAKAFERREGFQIEFRLRRADGQYRWLLNGGEPLFSAEAAFAGFIGGCIDIQERKELEDRLRAEESRSRLAMEAAGMGFWDWTIGGKIRWSPEHNRMLGIPAARREGAFEEFLACVVPADRDRITSALERAMSERTDFQAEFRAVTPDGQSRWIAGHGRALYDEESGHPKRMLGVIQDITERRRSEDRLRQNQEELRFALAAAETARDEAENANRAKDQFLAVLSHELRTPLTPVLMATSTLRMQNDLPDAVRFSLDMIQRNIKTEARLIDDLLDLTRIARNKLEFKRKPMDVQSALHEAIQICRPDIDAANLRIEVILGATHSLVMGDFARLQQVFWNLIKNAVKFTPSGGLIRIHTDNSGGMVRVTVEDDGIGIAPHILPRIFRPFEQGDAEVVRQYGGLGLGLAISLASVEGHGGRLTAESEGPGKGSRFVVELQTLEEHTP
ncbi:MAG: PAS domain-containing protein [Terrimicrobiaceae bacterium]|nr:PAS domain-containing protein [Terrimicrobiaceae bacterium]